MKDENNILQKAIEQLNSEPIPPTPPAELTKATISKLNDSADNMDHQSPQVINLYSKTGAMGILGKISLRIAVAAILMLCAGYAVGRLTAPKLNPEQLRKELYSSLKPQLKESLEEEIHTKLSEEMTQSWQIAFAKTYIQLKEELSRQYRDDINRFAAQTLAASNAATNQLLGELVQSINTAQTKDMQRIARAIYDLEQQQLKDKRQFAQGLKTLAYETDDRLEQTKQQMFQYLTNPLTQTPQLDQIEKQ